MLGALDHLVASSEKASGEIAAQGNRVTIIETRLDERTHDIEDLGKQISRVRHDHSTTVGLQTQLVSDVKRLTDEVRDLKGRSLAALGGGGALGGGLLYGIIELVRSALSSGAS